MTEAAELLLTYDVETNSPEGQARLRRVARLCEGHGIRVQKSVFEIVADAPTLLRLLDRIEHTIDPDADSIRIYRLPKNGLAAVTTRGTASKTDHHATHIF